MPDRGLNCVERDESRLDGAVDPRREQDENKTPRTYTPQTRNREIRHF